MMGVIDIQDSFGDVRQNPEWPATCHLDRHNYFLHLSTYPLVICYIGMENGPFIVDLPIENGDCP